MYSQHKYRKASIKLYTTGISIGVTLQVVHLVIVT